MRRRLHCLVRQPHRLGHLQDGAQCVVDGSVCRKGLRQLGIEEYEVGARAILLDVLARTPPFIEPKSYSGRISFADFRLAFFIEPSFVTCGPPGADDPDHVAFFSVHDHQEPPVVGHADG